MNRIAPPPSPPPDAVADILRRSGARLGFVPETLRVMARKPALIRAWYALITEAYLKPGEVPAPLKRLVAHTVSRAAGCAYSMAHTAHAAAEAGVAPDRIAAVFDCAADARFTDAERAALALARHAGEVPNAVTDADFDALRAHFTEDQIVEIVAVLALFGFLNRWQATLALTLEDAPRRFAEIHLTGIGWTAGRHGPGPA